MVKEPSAKRGFVIVLLLIGLTVILLMNPRQISCVFFAAVLMIGAMLLKDRSRLQGWIGDIRAFFSAWAEISGQLPDPFNDPLPSSSTSTSLPVSISASSIVLADPLQMPRVYTIRLPKETQWRPDQATVLMSKLMLLGRVILRIVATQDAIVWQLIDANERLCLPDAVKHAVRGAFIDAEVSDPQLPEQMDVNHDFWRRIDFYQQSEAFLRPSLQAGDIHRTDPLTSIVNSFIDLQEGEQVSYLLAFGVVDCDFERLAKLGVEAVTKSKAGAVAWHVLDAVLSQGSWENAIGAGAGAAVGGTIWGGRPPKYPEPIMKACVEKLGDGFLLPCYVAVEANSRTRERLNQFEFFTTFVKHFSTEYQTFIHALESDLHVTTQHEEQRTNTIRLLLYLLTKPVPPLDTRACVLTVSEMAALWHLPHEGMTASEIAWLKGKQVAAPPEFRGKHSGVRFGINAPTRSEIYQPVSERSVHSLIFGKTGTGKTSFLHGQIEQDIKAGNGVAVIEPMGNLVRRILQHSIPPEREDDVVVLDIEYAFDEKGTKVWYPLPLNPLGKQPGMNLKRSAGEFAALLGKLHQESGNTRWMQVLQAALLTLSAEDTPTLYDIRRVIYDTEYRAKLLTHFDFSTREMWEMLESSGALRDSSVGSILWRLNEFLGNDVARLSTCHPQKLDMYSLIRDNKIILVSVHADEGILPKSAQNLLGAIVLSQIQMAAMAKAVRDPKTKPFMLYVDEVQNFVTSSLDDIARQARQNGLGLVMATQYLESIAPKTLKAIEGNIGTLVAFECGQDDAENAVSQMGAFTVVDLINLGRFKTAVSMRSADGLNRAAFSLDPVTAPDVSNEPTAIARELYLRQKSVEKYTRMTYAQVSAWLDRRYGGHATPAPNDDEQGSPIT